MTAAQEGLARQNRPKGREVGQSLRPPLHTVTHPRFSRTTQISKTLLPGAHKDSRTHDLMPPKSSHGKQGPILRLHSLKMTLPGQGDGYFIKGMGNMPEQGEVLTQPQEEGKHGRVKGQGLPGPTSP